MADNANETMGMLETAAQRIDEVVGFIRNIAGQTNLSGAQCHHRGRTLPARPGAASPWWPRK